ncbi:MAG: histidinol-phosphate transaminase [Deltaproteobacteria bacterium]|nr:histidinol-phosphate transaminase [Deltaproteobacteria bacterium]
MPRLIVPHAGQGDLVLFRRPPALNSLVPEFVKTFEPYIPSRPPEVLKKQYRYATLYHLNNNENALGPPPAAQQVLRDFPPFNATYYPSGDSYHLRLRLAEFYGLHPDQFIVGNGANESITLLIKAFCESGDNIVTADKTYGGYEWVARFSGIGALLAPLSGLAFDPEAMLAKLNDRTKIVFVCNPNNPTGTYWSRRQLTDFLDRVAGRCIVVIDEAYCEFVDRADFPDGMSLIGTYPNLVIFRTFSKMYGLAGLRIGYLAADIDVINIIHRTAVVYSVNAPAQAAALAALGDREHILRTRAMVAAGKDFLKKELSLLGLAFSYGEGNYLSIKLPFSDSFAYRRMMQKGVMVRMMTAFRFPNSIRITIAKPEAMEACVAALAYALKDMGGIDKG